MTRVLCPVCGSASANIHCARVRKQADEIDRLEAALHKIEDGRGGDPQSVAHAALMHDALEHHKNTD